MVKMSETIMCQRFVQNTWKKDLCSNCFKSKEDHVVVPEKKITYRWTSHVDNFPQHGILRRNEKSPNEKSKSQTVSFQTNETEIIGFGGEEYSSDDDYDPPYREENTAQDAEENEEEDKEFRKLTQTNTDFNSIPANLRNDKVASAPTNGAAKTYSNLKLGTPLTDANGRRQTLQVSVEPYKNSVTVNGTGLTNDGKTHSKKILVEASKPNGCDKTEKSNGADEDNRVAKNNVVLSETPVICDIEANVSERDSVNVTSVNVNETRNEENIYSQVHEEDDETPPSVTNVVVNASKGAKVEEKTPNKEVVENMKNAKIKLEPLFKLGTYDMSSPKRLSIYQSTPQEAQIDNKEDKRRSMTFKDCNPIAGLPLITSKELEIEIDRPGSREMVGEPDGKADSDDSADPLLNHVYEEVCVETDSSVFANPQRSFLHGFLKEKPKPACKPVTLQNGASKKASATPKEAPETMNSVPSTPKMQISNTCNGTGSTKRQAPKPPSPKTAPQTPTHIVSTPVTKCETTLLNHTNDASTNGVKRRLNLDLNLANRNSLSVSSYSSTNDNIKSSPLGNGSYCSIIYDDKENTGLNESPADSVGYRSATKCSRSLSCDSIVTPNGAVTFSEKSRKYSGATIKVKSTIRKFLRFNRDDDKADEPQIPSVPRRRIEIIHPLDLNKSSIEILRPASAEGENQKTDGENERKTAPTTPTGPPPGRPTKPPPPPRTQSLDQKMISEISKPVRPPPPKSLNLKTQPKYECVSKTSNNVYENLGESRQAVAPAKPQRASSMRDRARQTTTVAQSTNENLVSQLVSEREAVPECDRNSQSDACETPSTSSINYCGSETESEMYQSVASSMTDSASSEIPDECEQRKSKTILHSSFEDNYGAVVMANHETLSQLLEQVANNTLVPNALKILQTTSHIRFEHFVMIENSKVTVGDWNFYNAKWNGSHDVVVSVSNKPLGPMKSLPSAVTLFPLVKFTDMIPCRYLKHCDTSSGDVNAYITVWNEQRIECISSFCKKPENFTACEGGLLLVQLTNAFNHLQACGIEDISLDEILICKRDADVESKLLLLPISIDYITGVDKSIPSRMSLCKCIPTVLNMLLPKHQISEVVKRVLDDEKATSLSQAKAVAEYWLWGPLDVTSVNDRQAALQRWLDLERATFLHKAVCRNSAEFNLNERCHLMFLVRTNAKLLTEASLLLEKK